MCLAGLLMPLAWVASPTPHLSQPVQIPTTEQDLSMADRGRFAWSSHERHNVEDIDRNSRGDGINDGVNDDGIKDDDTKDDDTKDREGDRDSDDD